MTVTVRVLDNETGEEQTTEIPDGEYFLITVPPCFTKMIDVRNYGETHVLTIKGREKDLNKETAHD